MQRPANNHRKAVNATETSNDGTMTKSRANAHNSLMVDAKATRTISLAKRHVIINATDQELAKVSDHCLIFLTEFVVFGCGYGFGF